MHTAYPDFQDALTTIVDAGTTTTVTLGWPAGGYESEHVVIAGEGEITPSEGVSGYSQRDEVMTCEVRVKVDYTTSDYTTARDRAFAISDEVEAAITADVTLGGVVTFARVTHIRVDEAIPDERTRTVGIALTVTADVTVS